MKRRSGWKSGRGGVTRGSPGTFLKFLNRFNIFGDMGEMAKLLGGHREPQGQLWWTARAGGATRRNSWFLMSPHPSQLNVTRAVALNFAIDVIRVTAKRHLVQMHIWHFCELCIVMWLCQYIEHIYCHVDVLVHSKYNDSYYSYLFELNCVFNKMVCYMF